MTVWVTSVAARGSAVRSRQRLGGSPVLTRLFGGRRASTSARPSSAHAPRAAEDNGCGVRREQIHTDANYQNGDPLQALTLAHPPPFKARRNARADAQPAAHGTPQPASTGLEDCKRDDARLNRMGAPRDEGGTHCAQSSP